jgi:hypothetical protein
MPTIGPMIAASARLALGYGERLLANVAAEQFSAFARIGDTTIESNHPAFIYGHLSLYSSRVIEQLGADASAYQPTEDFVRLFSKDAKCVDDPDRAIYPEMSLITERLFSGHRAVIDALEHADDELFSLENPTAVMREKFPTIGAMHGFYVGGHFMLHMGQMSAWRRAMGLGAA